MSTLNEMFATDATQEVTTGSRGLAGTAQLTALSSEIAQSIINIVNDNYEEYKELLNASKTDNNAMDKLINKTHDLSTADISFLQELSEEVTTGMLKSQQSKRSRSKSKVMTMDNYRTMMTAAVAENLIRLATGKDKSSSGTRRLSGSVEYTEEQLLEYEVNQELLKKELRNVQSKKSIMKSKADFDESDDRWKALLIAEMQLKERRVTTGAVHVVQVDKTKDALSTMLETVDVEHLNAADSKALLEQIKSMLTSETTEDVDPPVTLQDIVDIDGI